jgi:hypothetical protein
MLNIFFKLIKGEINGNDTWYRHRHISRQE